MTAVMVGQVLLVKMKQKAKLTAMVKQGSPAKHRPLSAADFNKYKAEMPVC